MTRVFAVHVCRTGCPIQWLTTPHPSVTIPLRRFSTSTHNLIAVLVIAAGVILCGGLALFGCGASAAPKSESFACPLRHSPADPLRVGEWTISAVQWRNESWTRPAGVGVGISGKAWSRPLLPDHAELAASEHATKFDANEANQTGKLHFHASAIGVISPALLGALAHSPVLMDTLSYYPVTSL